MFGYTQASHAREDRERQTEERAQEQDERWAADRVRALPLLPEVPPQADDDIPFTFPSTKQQPATP